MNAPVKTTPSVLYPVVPKPVVRVLVVDDNSNDRELLQARFVKAGMADKVTFVSNGTVAWEMLTSDSEAAHQTLCAVLLDLKMPGLSGLELLRMLRLEPKTKKLPVFIISGSTEPQTVAACESLGVSGFVPKPISYPAFCKAIASIFHQKTQD